ncbi:16S rRNA (guanine(966)-N(2))-methyltransferase RsmD [Oscillospiraceae bacterium OttesenSCG-928-F05]|nr:16S rRNA (guanine(966)-N(2))-methyltransferase RsmD [Oscillospiraceae bacterium OttesenSCG-928-F05]
MTERRRQKMRVIAGSEKGRKLVTLDGEGTRPTAERVKEAMMSIVQFEIEGRKVLDLYAGSGQLGIELLSRGAGAAVFVDQSKRAVEIIKKNLALCGMEGRSEVVTADAHGYVARAPKQGFDLIFADPPYEGAAYGELLEAIERFDILKTHGIIVLEMPDGTDIPGKVGRLELSRAYRYGRIGVAVYRLK